MTSVVNEMKFLSYPAIFYQINKPINDENQDVFIFYELLYLKVYSALISLCIF